MYFGLAHPFCTASEVGMEERAMMTEMMTSLDGYSMMQMCEVVDIMSSV
jgi:hypothetical protein